MSTLKVNSIQTAGGTSPVLVTDIAKKSDLASSGGAALAGYLPAGTGAVATTVQAVLREAVSATRYGADPTGVSDSSPAITAAFLVSNDVTLPPGNFKLTSAITIPPFGRLLGAGMNNTTVTATGNNVAFVLQYWSQLRDLKVVKSGAHTKNLIEVGSATLDAGRATISDVWVQGAGADGIQLIYGNLGLLQNIVSISNGLNGIRFLAGNGDLNAWTLQGYIDLRGNGNDGLRIEGGASLGDPLCSKSNFISGVSSQENGQYGVFIGTRSNLVEAYVELNTSENFVLGTYAYGNRVSTVQSAGITDSGTGNLIDTHSLAATYERGFASKVKFSGVSGKGWRVSNDDGASGWLDFSKTAANTWEFVGGGSSGNHTLRFRNSAAPTAYFTTQFGGNTQPDTDNAFNFGTGALRWATLYAATGTINTSDARAKQDITALDEAEKRVAVALKGLIKTFRFKDAVQAKGDAARIHIGVIAQEVIAAFDAEGLDAHRYGIICYDEWEEAAEVMDEDGNVTQAARAAGNRYGVRYEELFAFIISAL